MEITDERCPFCGGKCKIIEDKNKIRNIECNEEDKKCILHPSIWVNCSKEELIKRQHLIYLYLLKYSNHNVNGNEAKYYFFFEEKKIGDERPEPHKINVAELMINYPKNFMEQVENSLLNLHSRYPKFGNIIAGSIDQISISHLLYCQSYEVESFLDLLYELGYIIKQEHPERYRISAEGWKKISELKSDDSTNQGFIAMAFSDETKSIGETFKKAIHECGYIPRRIDEKEHNNQIVPEIMYEISRSKFVVVDITIPNYGAYYEAGYAEALKKQVIICCREKEFNGDNKPHFDIAQKSTIVWKDEADLCSRLKRRIEATVGLNRTTNGN